MNLYALGAMLNSALYLTAVVVAGLWTGHGWSWKLGIAAFGLTYLGYLAQFCQQPPISDEAKAGWRVLEVFMVPWSIMVGFAAGLMLLF